MLETRKRVGWWWWLLLLRLMALQMLLEFFPFLEDTGSTHAKKNKEVCVCVCVCVCVLMCVCCMCRR